MSNLQKVLLLCNQFISIFCCCVSMQWNIYHVILTAPMLGLTFSQGSDSYVVLCMNKWTDGLKKLLRKSLWKWKFWIQLKLKVGLTQLLWENLTGCVCKLRVVSVKVFTLLGSWLFCTYSFPAINSRSRKGHLLSEEVPHGFLAKRYSNSVLGPEASGLVAFSFLLVASGIEA